MRRRVVEGSLSFCVALLTWGVPGMAADEAAIEPIPPSAGLPADGPSTDAASFDGTTYDLPSDAGTASSNLTPCPDCREEPIGDGMFGWRPRFPHFSLPSRSYSLFRSPVSYGWRPQERCAPTPWTPRGNGIPRRTSCDRMDFRPYELRHDSSKHGPAFYRRFNLYPCPECHEHAVHLQRFYGPPR